MFWLSRRRFSYKRETGRISPTMDPLDFLSAGTATTRYRDAFSQIHSVVHASLEEVDKSIQLIFEQLRAPGAVADRVIIEANGEIRKEMVRATFLTEQQKDLLCRDVHSKLESLYIQSLIAEPHQDPGVKRWISLSARTARTELPEIPEYSPVELARPEDRRRRVPRWQSLIDEWLETQCRNHVCDVIAYMEAEIQEYIASWFEVTSTLRRHSSLGGALFRQVVEPDTWTFESDDPTVRNLLRGGPAQDIASRILGRFQLTNREIVDLAELVRVSLEGTPAYGTGRVGLQELEDLLALAVSEKIQDNVSMEAGFLSVFSNGLRLRDDLGELLADMQRGASAMEQKVWRVGEIGVGHVDSASGVGVTDANVHDIVLRGLGGGRRFAAVEGHPGDNHRFNVQMSIVGAPASDLTIFREMVAAWYAWHFDYERLNSPNDSGWRKSIKNESWKLYPDIGTDTGVRNAIMEFIADDLVAMWQSPEGMASYVTNGLSPEQELMHGLWTELGIAPQETGSRGL